MSTHPPQREHLTPEQLAAYVDHGLSLAERNRAEQHMATCDQCTRQLAATMRTAAELAHYLPDDLPPPLVSRRAVAGAVLAALVAAMALAVLGGSCGV